MRFDKILSEVVPRFLFVVAVLSFASKLLLVSVSYRDDATVCLAAKRAPSFHSFQTGDDNTEFKLSCDENGFLGESLFRANAYGGWAVVVLLYMFTPALSRKCISPPEHEIDIPPEDSAQAEVRRAKLIKNWKLLLASEESSSWVLFNNGTCIILRNFSGALEVEAKRLLESADKNIGHGGFRDLNVSPIPEPSGWIVTGEQPNVRVFVDPSDFNEPLDSDLQVGLVGRINATFDAKELLAIFIHESR